MSKRTLAKNPQRVVTTAVRRVGPGGRPGAAAALAALLDEHAPLIRKVAGCVRPDCGDDAFQDAVVKLLESGAPPPGVKNPAGWVVRVTRHASIDRLRGRQPERRRDAERGWHERRVARLAEAAETDDMRAAVREALDRLPRAYRVVADLALAGVPDRQAAETLGVTVAAYRSRLTRAKRRLRELVAG